MKKILLVPLLLLVTLTALAATTIDLGTANSFAILAGSGITDTNPSVIVGDVGSDPTTANGLTNGEVTGTNYTAASAVVTQAKVDLVTAYNNAGLQAPSTVPTELGGTTKLAGVYNSLDGTFGITGTLTLDAQGDPNAVFIFQTSSTLITAGASVVQLRDGAQACNVFWRVGSSATLDTTSTFAGNILALTSITDNGGSTVSGRLLARNGAVTLNNTRVTKANCSVPTPPKSTSSRAGDSNYPVPQPVSQPPVQVIESIPVIPIVPSINTFTYTTPGMPSTGVAPFWLYDKMQRLWHFIFQASS